jgi:exodeoxyribonuclease III
MKIATWNINSIRMRIPRLLSFLARHQPDVVCLQETKVIDALFPLAEIEAAGYHAVINGQKSYNGVAILSRGKPENIVRNLPDDKEDAERRLIAANINGVNIINVYAPNGSAVGSDKYIFKLEWYRRLCSFLHERYDMKDDVLICGDFNVAPDERDVWDVALWEGKILFSEPEKAALNNLIACGFIDTLRLHHSQAGLFTWWDYRAGAFHRGWGLRIDHVLVSASLAARSIAVEIDRDERKGEKPSDHAPVIATFN